MARDPLVIIHDFGPAGYRRYLQGQKPGKWKSVDEIYGCKDDKNNGEHKKNKSKKTAKAAGK